MRSGNCTDNIKHCQLFIDLNPEEMAFQIWKIWNFDWELS